MTQSIWSANAGSGGQGLFDLFANLEASKMGDEAMAELGPQSGDISAADLNFFGALNDALANMTAASQGTQTDGLPQGEFTDLQGNEKQQSQDDQLALALLAGGSGAAYLPNAQSIQPRLSEKQFNNTATEVLYAAPSAVPKFNPLLQLHQQKNRDESGVLGAQLGLEALQTNKNILQMTPQSNATQPQTVDLQSAQKIPSIDKQALSTLANDARPLQNMQQLRDDLARIAPEAKIEMLSVGAENQAAAVGTDAGTPIPLSKSLAQLGETLKDHQLVFNKRLNDLEGKMSARLDESLEATMAADQLAALKNSQTATATQPSPISKTEQPTAATALTTQQQQTQENMLQNPAQANLVHPLNQRVQMKANVADNKKEDLKSLEQLLDASRSANAEAAAGLEANMKKEGEGQEKKDEKRDGLTSLLEHKGLGKVWTAERSDKGFETPNVSPLARGTLERTRNMAMQLQGRGGTAKIQISDAKVGTVNLEIRVEQGNKVFVEIRSGNQKLKEELRDNVEALKRSFEDNRMSLAEVKFTVENAAMQSSATSNSQQHSQQNSNSRQDAQNLQQQLQERAQQENLNRQFFGGQNSGQNSFQNSGENFAQGEIASNAVRNKIFNQSSAANLNSRETNIQRSANGSLKVRA